MNPSDLLIFALGGVFTALTAAALAWHKRSWIEVLVAGVTLTLCSWLLNRLAPPTGAIALVFAVAVCVAGTLVSVCRTPRCERP